MTVDHSVEIVRQAFMLALFASQQIGWYQHLEPDRASQQAIACLDAAGLRAARAPYWQSYTLTFLTNEPGQVLRDRFGCRRR